MSGFMSVFSFDLPTKIIFGPGSASRLNDELLSLGVKRPLIVTDQGIVNAGILSQATTSLQQSITYHVYSDVSPNPKDTEVSVGAKQYTEFGADCILALGGGSPIDCAKSVAILAANSANDIKAYEGKNKPSNPLPPLICLPTTAGSGSEVTYSSVITDTKNNYKMTIKNQYTAPVLSICDPELSASCPPPLTASCGMDALTHAIEAYSATCSTPLSDAAALYAIELLYGSLAECVTNGSNVEARSRVLMGSILAGIAFSRSDVASVHCLAEALGGMYDLPHGVCNAVLLPFVMEYNMSYCEEKYARIARAMGLSYDTEKEGAANAVKAVKRLAQDVSLPSFGEFNISQNDYDTLAVISEKNLSTPSNPRPMTKTDYLNILHAAANGK